MLIPSATPGFEKDYVLTCSSGIWSSVGRILIISIITLESDFFVKVADQYDMASTLYF